MTANARGSARSGGALYRRILKNSDLPPCQDDFSFESFAGGSRFRKKEGESLGRYRVNAHKCVDFCSSDAVVLAASKRCVIGVPDRQANIIDTRQQVFQEREPMGCAMGARRASQASALLPKHIPNLSDLPPVGLVDLNLMVVRELRQNGCRSRGRFLQQNYVGQNAFEFRCADTENTRAGGRCLTLCGEQLARSPEYCRPRNRCRNEVADEGLVAVEEKLCATEFRLFLHNLCQDGRRTALKDEFVDTRSDRQPGNSDEEEEQRPVSLHGTPWTAVLTAPHSLASGS